MSEPRRVVVGERELTLTNLDKVLYPDAGFTKGQVVDYHLRVAPVLVEHLRGRPLTLRRFPDGVTGESFYEKNCPRHRPDWVATVEVPLRSRTIAFCEVSEPATLVWLANLAALELHPLLSRAPGLEHPTHLVFDLDPGPPAGLLEAAEVALVLREALAAATLDSVVKSSGGKGLHVGVPLDRTADFDQTKAVAKAVAEALERHWPERVVSVMAKDRRVGKVLVDWSQNDRHKSTVSAYSLRGRVRPTVSVPLTWEEVAGALDRGDPAALLVEAPEVPDRLADLGDLWACVNGPGQPLGRALQPTTA